MRTKKNGKVKKLVLNKSTIANLKAMELNMAKGGTSYVDTFDISCDSNGGTFVCTVCDWTEGPHCTMHEYCPNGEDTEGDRCPPPSPE